MIGGTNRRHRLLLDSEYTAARCAGAGTRLHLRPPAAPHHIRRTS